MPQYLQSTTSEVIRNSTSYLKKLHNLVVWPMIHCFLKASKTGKWTRQIRLIILGLISEIQRVQVEISPKSTEKLRLLCFIPYGKVQRCFRSTSQNSSLGGMNTYQGIYVHGKAQDAFIPTAAPGPVIVRFLFFPTDVSKTE